MRWRYLRSTARYCRTMNPILIGLVTGLVTGGAAVFGVWFSQRKALQLAEAERLDNRKEAVRALIATLLVNSRSWKQNIYVLSTIWSRSTAAERGDWDLSSTAQEGVKQHAAMQQSFVEARIRIGDELLGGLIEKARLSVKETATISGAAIPLEGGGSPEARRKKLNDLEVHLAGFDDLLDAIEDESSRLLKEPMEDLRLAERRAGDVSIRRWKRAIRRADRGGSRRSRR